MNGVSGRGVGWGVGWSPMSHINFKKYPSHMSLLLKNVYLKNCLFLVSLCFLSSYHVVKRACIGVSISEMLLWQRGGVVGSVLARWSEDGRF